MTNGDKIRSMSNAELEEFIHYRTNCGCCNFKYRGDTCFKKPCKEGITEWLESECMGNENI